MNALAVAAPLFNIQAVIDRACTNRVAYDNPADSRRAARELSKRRKVLVRSYRCPFGDGFNKHAHWHVGTVPSLAGLEAIARAIRESHQSCRTSPR